jgi:hypothetical protein
MGDRRKGTARRMGRPEPTIAACWERVNAPGYKKKADTHSSEGERGIEPKATRVRCDSRVGVLARVGRVYVKAETHSSGERD